MTWFMMVWVASVSFNTGDLTVSYDSATMRIETFSDAKSACEFDTLSDYYLYVRETQAIPLRLRCEQEVISSCPNPASSYGIITDGFSWPKPLETKGVCAPQLPTCRPVRCKKVQPSPVWEVEEVEEVGGWREGR